MATNPCAAKLRRAGAPIIPACENHGREQDEPRHDTAEDRLRGHKQQKASGKPANKTDRREDRHIDAAVGRGRRETVARGVTGRDLAREQCDGA
jgi:hypothetical protein